MRNRREKNASISVQYNNNLGQVILSALLCINEFHCDLNRNDQVAMFGLFIYELQLYVFATVPIAYYCFQSNCVCVLNVKSIHLFTIRSTIYIYCRFIGSFANNFRYESTVTKDRLLQQLTEPDKLEIMLCLLHTFFIHAIHAIHV